MVLAVDALGTSVNRDCIDAMATGLFRRASRIDCPCERHNFDVPFEEMTTITERQSTTRQSSRNEAARLAGEVPSPPNELYGILRENAALSAKQQAVISKTAIPNVEDKPPLGTRNPYLPLLKRSSSLTSTISSGASTLARDIWSGLFHTPPSTRTSGSSTFSTIPETPIENSREDSIPQRPDRITPAPPINATSSTAGKNTIEHVSMTEEPPGQQLASTEPETSNEKSSKDLFPQRPDQITPAPSINATSSTVGKNTIEYASVAKEPPGQKLASAEPLKPYKVVQFGKRCYVCTEMPIPLETTRMWNESIKKLVEDVLHASSAAKADSETAMTLELYMANTTSKNLRPSILITCCSSKMKKQIRSVLGEKRWLKKSGFQYIVQVDKSFGYRTDDSGVEPFTLEIQARIPISPETFCGVEARIAPGTNEDDNPSIVKFTIGGMISIDGTLCYLAAAHPFAPASRPATVSSEASSEEDDSDGSLPTTSRSSSGTVINHTSNGNRGKGQTGEALPAPFPETFTETWPKLPYREISHGGVLAITRFRPGAENLDWALLIASNTPALPIPGEHKATPLLPDIITSTELTPGPVLVAAGSGLRRGNLNTSAASIFLRGSIHNVKQITLESSLPYGDSGSWVISENRLCGIIIAGRDHLPWAYMLPIEEVFLDIEKTCGFFPIINGGHEISDAQHLIPTEAYDYSQVETGTGSLAGPEERLSDVIHSAPIREIITENEKTQYSETPPNNLPGRVHPSVLHVFGLMLWIFLDDSGTSTAIPKITDHFNSLDDIGWYSSATTTFYSRFCFLNLLVGSMIATVAAGLMTLLTPEIDNSAQKAYAIGICVLLGTGVGLGFPIPFLAARLSHDRQFSQLVRLVTFPAGFGAIFLSVAQSIFVNTLASNLNDAVDNNITTKFLLDAGITNLPGMFPPDQQEAVLGAYNASLRNVFYLATGLFGVSIFGGLGMINVCRMWLEGTEAADEIQTRRPVSPLGAPEMGYGPLPLAPELNVGGIDRPTVISFPRELPGPRSVDGRLD
ncbi:hypothetical protein G7Y89_g10354 [Cudoniella acicularis]|uniref:Uncharacterized protein n=1 Tax=Cudoniella acicularis TaxID=354080 RepID=A0A8H4RF94_9HELO|nr:hypothetical protein G7Y89_g10354 [Cudoniella acicularis]